MVKIVLESARNGVIKRIIEDNHGGTSEHLTSVDVYEEASQDSSKFEFIMKFFFDLCEDLGLDLGNKFSKEVITIKKEWGSHYTPTQLEIKNKIAELELQIQSLQKEWKKS